MSTDPPEWESNIYGILPGLVSHRDESTAANRDQPTDLRILMLPGETGWSLPHVRINEPIGLGNLGVVTREMQAALGTHVIAYRYASYTQDRDRLQEDGVYMLENYSPSLEPPARGRWVGREALAELDLARPEHRATIEACIAEAEGGVVPEQRPPWQIWSRLLGLVSRADLQQVADRGHNPQVSPPTGTRPATRTQSGWFDRAVLWTETRLAELGYTLVSPVEQVRNWSISCILRVRTTADDVYFKVAADLPLFVNEPVLLEGLARLYPDQVPTPLAIDREQGWMLLAGFGEPLGWDAPIEVREEMIRSFGQLQVGSAARVDELLAMGCVDRRLDRLVAQIDPLLGDTDALSGLDEAEIEQLREYGPQLKAMCVELSSYAVPDTLMHGDLHANNVAIREGKMLFFDWTDGCVAHPFLDMLMIFGEEDEVVRTRLRDRYLALWTAYEPMERLLEVWALCETLHALHHAVSYQYIVANIEAGSKGEFGGAVVSFLRKALERMRERARSSSGCSI